MAYCFSRSQPAPFFAFAVQLLTVGMLFVAVDSATTYIDFAFVQATVADNEPVQFYAGLRAAEMAIKANGGILPNGTEIRFNFTTGINSAATAQALLAKVASRQFYGIVAPDLLSSQYLLPVIVAAGGTVPVLGARMASPSMFTSALGFTLNIRTTAAADTQMILQHALHTVSIRCSRFIIVGTSGADGMPSMIATAQAVTRSIGLPDPVVVYVAANLTNMSYALDLWYGDGSNVPGCSIAALARDQIQGLAVALYYDPRFQGTSYFIYAANILSKIQYSTNRTTDWSSVFKNLYAVEFLPSPTNASNPMVAAYQTALQNWLATSPVVPPQLAAQILDPEPSYYGLEAYATGMLVASLVSRVPSLTQAKDLLTAAYQQKYFFVNDTVLGPFTRDCSTTAYLPLPCFCNSGSRVQTMANGRNNGRMKADDSNIAGVSYSTTGLQDCYPSATSIRYPVGFFVPLNLDVVPSVSNVSLNGTQFHEALLSGMSAASNAVNKESRAFGYFAGVPLPIYNNTEASSASSVSAYESDLVAKVRQRYTPYMLLGNEIANVTNVAQIHVRTSSAPPIQPLALTSATRYSMFTLELDAALSDLVHGGAAYANSAFGAASSARSNVVARVVSDNFALMSLSVQSLNTFQFTTQNDRFDMSNSDADVDDAVSWAFNSAGSSDASVVLMVSVTSSSIAVKFASRFATAASSSTSQVLDRILILAPWSHQTLYDVRFGANAVTSVSSNAQLTFLTPLPAFWDATASTLRTRLRTAYNTTQASIIEDPRRADAFAFVRLIADVTSTFTQSQNSPTVLLSVLYSGLSLEVDNVAFGPLFSSNCSAAVVQAKSPVRTCQCNRMRQQISAFRYSDWLQGISNATNYFAYQLEGCEPVYKELVLMSSSSNTAAVIGGAVGGAGGGCLLIGLLLFIGCCSGRSNWSAPKDPDSPFAIVFTDIQSSTSLWARAPEEMASSVDQHHDLIRRLIARYNGYEVKTIGDSFMIAFKKATDAMALALEIQAVFFSSNWPEDIDNVYRDLEAEKAEEPNAAKDAAQQWNDDVLYPTLWKGIRVRVGLHWGVGSVKFDPVSRGYDYYGTVVNTAARVEGVGNGGQVLCTKDFFEALEAQGYSFQGIVTTPLGPQPLRGLDAPLPLYQLAPEALAGRRFGPLRLDVDAGALESESATHSQNGTDASHLSSADAVASKYLKGANSRLVEDALHVADVLTSVFSTSKESWRTATIKQLSKAWRITNVSLPSHILIAVAARALLATTAKQELRTNQTPSMASGVSGLHHQNSHAPHSNAPTPHNAQQRSSLLVPSNAHDAHTGRFFQQRRASHGEDALASSRRSENQSAVEQVPTDHVGYPAPTAE